MSPLSFYLMRFISSSDESMSGPIETAERVADGVTRVVFTALERNVLIGVIVLGILGTISFAFLWVRERGALSVRVHKAIEKASEERTADRRSMEQAIEKNGDDNVAAIKKVEDQMVKLFRENTAEFKELRNQEQSRSDRKEDLLRDFAINTVSSLDKMSNHLEHLGGNQ